MSTDAATRAADLAAVLAAALAVGEVVPEVTGLARLSGGASRETWAFDATYPGATARPLVLQRERRGGARAATGMAVEARLLRAAATAGVAVPAIALAEGDPGTEAVDLGGPWLIAERIEGETIARRILRDPDLEAARQGLAVQCGAALAAVHRIPLSEAEGLDESDPVEQYRSILDQLGQPHPVFEVALRWLAANRPEVGDVTVVHGDFRNGNLVVGPDGLRAVLDWELSHRGDPVEDLGWLCVRAWRFGSPLPVGGFGTKEDLLAAYEAGGGRPVDPAALHWWEVMGTLRWGVICIMQTSAHLLGLSRSVELAAIGRRVAETEHDLLVLLPGEESTVDAERTPPAPTGPESEIGTSMPHDVPTAAGLVEAVREFLEGDVAAATEGRVRFHARVAVNVLAMVERELGLGEQHRAAHRARLDGLGYGDDRALAAAIRAGELDDRGDELRAALAAAVADKLAVANPTYADLG